MNNYLVYMHVNKANGKKYIGITSQSAKGRWKRGAGYKQQKRFYCAIQHYGWDGFDHYVLFDSLSKEEAEVKEEELIKEHRSNDLSFGYNIENGGRTNKLSDEQKEHLRIVNTGKKHTEETKKKMSESHKGMSSAWLTGRKQSEELKEKRLRHMKGKTNPRAKAVFQYDLDGNLIAEYPYMEAVKQSLNISKTSHISQCCNGQRGKAHGYMWSYHKEKKEPYQRLWKGGHSSWLKTVAE